VPEYDFRCKCCQHSFSLFFKNYADLESAAPVCPQCQSHDLSRLVRRVALMTSEERRLERLSAPARLGDLDQGDPRTLGHLMRGMADEFGGELDGEFHEVTARLEAGESPDSIEASLDEGD